MHSNSPYPDFTFMNFTSKEELFAYTSAENYTFEGGNLGVCFGFSMQEDENGWNLEMYFDD